MAVHLFLTKKMAGPKMAGHALCSRRLGAFMRAAFQQPVLAVGMRFTFTLRIAQLVGVFAVQRLLGFAGLAFDLAALGEFRGLFVVFTGGGLVALAFVALTHHVLQF
jgi:hypothetical protein